MVEFKELIGQYAQELSTLIGYIILAIHGL